MDVTPPPQLPTSSTTNLIDTFEYNPGAITHDRTAASITHKAVATYYSKYIEVLYTSML